MAKIITSATSAQQLYKYAKNCIKKQNYFDGIVALYDAIFIDSTKKEYRIALAEAYYKVGAYEKSSYEYYKLIADKYAHFEFVFALARNEYLLRRKPVENDFILSTLSNIKGLKHDHLEVFTEVLEDPIIQKLFHSLEQKTTAQPQLVNLKKRKDKAELVEIMEYMNKEDYDKVIARGYEVDSSNENYSYIRELMTSAAFKSGNFELSRSLATELNNAGRLSFVSFYVLAIAAKENSNPEGYAEFSENTIAKYKASADSEKNLQQLVLEFALLGDKKHTLSAAKILYALAPNNDKNLTYYTIALFQSKKNKDAGAMLKHALIMYPKDLKLKLIAFLFQNAGNRHWLNVLSDRFSPINTVLNNVLDDVFKGEINSENLPKVYDLLELSIYTDEELDIHGYLKIYAYLKFLLVTDHGNCKAFIVSLLYNYQINIAIRYVLVEILLVYGNIDSQVLFLSDEEIMEVKLRSLDPKLLDRNPKNIFILAYTRVFSTMLRIGIVPAPRIIGAVIKDMSFCTSKLLNFNALSAVAHYFYSVYQGTPQQLETLAIMYESTPKTLKKYVQEYNLSFK